MELRALSSEDKSAIKSELKDMPMDDLVATHRRLHQWAARGNLLSGFTKQDMEWLHNAVEAELRRRAKEDDREPPESSPLEWGRSDPEESESGDDERWIPSTVKKIIAAAKKKKRTSLGDIERRFISGELRAQGEGDDRRIIGYAAVFNSLSEDLGGWKEMIEPGAFADTILADDIRGLYNHQPTMVLGRNKAGTLILVEDEVGLRYEIIPPDTSYARDLLVSIDRGDVNQSSFGFAVPRGGDVWIDPTESQPFPIRKVRKAKLFDVSPATFPAYPVTSVAVRDIAAQLLASAGRATGEDADPEPARRLALRKRQLELVERL